MAKKYLLFIDGKSKTGKFLSKEFAKLGFDTGFASTGKEGLNIMRRVNPDAIIVDPSFTDIKIEDFASRVKADESSKGATLILFDYLSGSGEEQKYLDMGFDQCVAKESDAISALAKTFETLSDSSSNNVKNVKKDLTIPGIPPKEDTKEGHVIVFLSAKGGTGTSSLCANLAQLFAEDKDKSTVVIDLVLPIGSISSIVGYEKELDIVNVTALSGTNTPYTYFQETLPKIKKWGFQLLAGSPNPEQANTLDISRIPIILNTIKPAFDYIFIDLGRSLSKVSLPIILSADQLVLIISPDKSTTTLTKSVLDYLITHGLKKEQLFPLINRAVGLEGLTKQEIDEMLDLKTVSIFPYMKGEFTHANNRHEPISKKYPGDVGTITLNDIKKSILERIYEED